jgi:4-amino-4-deoxy-L-arabinose transferase-like glycosyltransferase
MLLILAASVVLRVVVAFYLGDMADPPYKRTDQTSYHTLAVRLLQGKGYSFPDYWYPFTPPETPTAHWSFLYPALIAPIYALFGVHPLAARIVQAILGGILLPWMVYRLARRLFPGREPLALLSMACAAFYAFFILYAAMLMTESYYIIALLWSLERALALAERPTLRQGLILGAALGIAALLRQSILPWVIVLAAWLLWAGWRSQQLRRMFGGLASALLVLALAIAPFTMRNYRVYGEFLLLNSNAGYAMYSSQHPMHGTDFLDYTAAPMPTGLGGLNEAQLDRELMRRGIGFVLTEPGRIALLTLDRAVNFFTFWPTPGTVLLNNVGRVLSFGLFLPFMLYGLWLALRAGPLRSRVEWARFSLTPLALALLFMAFYSLLHILTWPSPRYRLPVDAAALPFAALAISKLAGRIGKKTATN